MKFNAKQVGIILVSLVIALVLNWVLWLLIMGHPTDIGIVYHILVVVCLATVFVHAGDRLTNAEIFR